MEIEALLRQRNLKVMPGDSFVERRPFRGRTRLRRWVACVDAIEAGPFAIRGSWNVRVGAAGLLLERLTRIDLEIRFRKPREEFRHGRLRSRDGLFGHANHFLTRFEFVLRIAAQSLEHGGHITRPERACRDGLHLRFDQLHLLEAEILNRLPVHVHGRVAAHSRAIAGGAVRKRRDGDAVACVSEVVGRQKGAVSRQRRRDLLDGRSRRWIP